MSVKDRSVAVILLSLLILWHLGWSSEAFAPSPLLIDFNGAIESNGIPEPWSLRQRSGKAEVGLVDENGIKVLKMKCVKASFSVERDVSITSREFPLLTWEWKATRLPSQGDVRRRGRNDQGLQVLVAFEDGKVISYIWDSGAPVGTVTDESVGWPFNLAIKTVVVASGDADINKWVAQRRNIYEDYTELFHGRPPRLAGLRLQANTQYTNDISEGFVKNITFSHSILN